MTDHTKKTAQAHSGLSRWSLLAMATASGIAAANIYYNQPILGIIKAAFPQDAITSFVPTATQLGFAAGLLLLLPLGDIVNRRYLIIAQFMALSVALVATAIAPTAWILVVASFAVGVGSAVAQQIVPFAASLAAPDKRGATIGTVMAGLLSGILLSRTLSGFVGQHAGWREMYWIGVPMALFTAALMFVALPNHRPSSRMPYRQAMVSLVHIWKREPDLRVAALVQAALFGSFSAFWTILALYLQGPDFHLGADVAGLFGVVGAVGIFAAPLAGRIADRRGPHFHDQHVFGWCQRFCSRNRRLGLRWLDCRQRAWCGSGHRSTRGEGRRPPGPRCCRTIERQHMTTTRAASAALLMSSWNIVADTALGARRNVTRGVRGIHLLRWTAR